jgi:plastocyanin
MKTSSSKDKSASKVITGLAILLAVLIGLMLVKTLLSPKSSVFSPLDKQTPTIPQLSAEEIERYKNSKDVTIIIRKSSFEPKTLTIKPFDQVFWENKDSKPHELRFSDQKNSIMVEPGISLVTSYASPQSVTVADASSSAEMVITVSNQNQDNNSSPSASR